MILHILLQGLCIKLALIAQLSTPTSLTALGVSASSLHLFTVAYINVVRWLLNQLSYMEKWTGKHNGYQLQVAISAFGMGTDN